MNMHSAEQPKNHTKKSTYSIFAEKIKNTLKDLFFREDTSHNHEKIIKQLKKSGFKSFPKNNSEVKYCPKTVFTYPREYQSEFELIAKLVNLPQAGRYYANDEVILGNYEHEKLDIQYITSKLSNEEYDPIQWADNIYFHCNTEEYQDIKSYFEKYGVKLVKINFNKEERYIKFEDPIAITSFKKGN